MAAEDEAPATGPRRGGVLTFTGFDGGILDPAIAIHGGTDSIVFPIYDHLNYMDNGGVLTAAMAELPEIVDDLTFVYNIKPNVHWQDKAPLNGRQFVAEDAAFGIQRFGQDNPEFVWRDRYSSVEQFEVTDDLTLTLKTREVFAPLLSAIGETQAVMVSRDAVEAFGDDGIASNIEAAVGTGGMQHVSREDGVVTVLERNPNYFREGLPYFDGFRANWNADGAYRAAQYVAGETDILFCPWLGFPAENEAVRGQVGEENLVEVPMNATWNWTAVHFHTQVEPYTDPRVRTALHLATDREQLLVTTQGVTEIGGPISHAIGAYAWTPDELRQLPGYRSGAQREEDLAEGRRLLDASGYDPASVPPMSASTGGGTPYAEVVQQNFAEIGFEVELLEVPDTEHNTRRAAGDFTISFQGYGGVFDPDALHGGHHTDGGRNYGEFSDPEIDALLEQGRSILGVENRLPIYDEIQTKLLEEHAPQIYCNWGRPVVGHRPWLKGFGPTNMQTAATYLLYKSWFEGKPGV
ncbi:MAG: ABC transporter substrate-binding protein [Chloroflexi bacterium]|nr:ABC transporter substrate-binding protein [Chloroflexota bacterium]